MVYCGRLNNSTITITFVVIYKLCASQQRGSVCVGVGVGVCASRCVHVCVCEGEVSLSLEVCLFCCRAVAAFKGCRVAHCSLPTRQIASSPLFLASHPLQASVLPAIVYGRNKLRLILCKYFMATGLEVCARKQY